MEEEGQDIGYREEIRRGRGEWCVEEMLRGEGFKREGVVKRGKGRIDFFKKKG